MTSSVAYDEPIVTLSDLIVRLGDRNGMGEGDTRMKRMITQSIRDALRDLPAKSNWRYYDRTFYLTSSAYTTVGVVYVDATKTLTITSGTLPSDAIYGEIGMSGSISRIKSISGSTVVLQDATGQDFTGNATWFRSTYRLPKIANLRRVFKNSNRQEITFISNEMLSTWNLSYNFPGTPVYYSIRNDSQSGANDLVFSPPPSEHTRYMINAIVAPVYPNVSQDFSTASGTNGTKIFTSPNAKATWVGAIVRTTPASTSKQESLLYAEFEWQSVIESVSGTTVTVRDALPATYTNETILVSSLLDIANGPMQTYFEALCHEYFCRNFKHDGLETAVAVSSKLFLDARGADSQVDRSTAMWMGQVYPWIVTDLNLATTG